MANTRFLTIDVEDYVRKVLTQRHGVGFKKKHLELVTGGTHEFDAVADDGSIIASIKSASGRTSGGRIPSGKIKDCVAELYFLSLVEIPTRILILTTPDFYEIFMRTVQGKVAPGVTISCEVLPDELQSRVQAVQLAASEEVRPVP